MYLPKPGEPASLLWFASGIGLISRSPYENQTRGTTCYLAMFQTIGLPVETREDTQSSAYQLRTPSRRRIFLN